MSEYEWNNEADPYAWLREENYPGDITDPRILEYLNAENIAFDEAMLETKDLQEQLYQELKGRHKEDDVSFPAKQGKYEYYSKTEAGKEHSIFFRSSDEGEELLLDINALSEAHPSLAFGSSSITTDGNKQAYSYDVNGSERYTIYVQDLQNSQNLADVITDTNGNIIWNKAGDGFYYLALGESFVSHQIFFHQLGIEQIYDALIYEEKDPEFSIEIEKSSSGEYLLIGAGSSSSNEYWYLNFNDKKLQLSMERMEDRLYSLDHMGDNFYLVINDLGKNFRLVSVNQEDNFDPNKFQEIVAHSATDYLTDVSLYQQYIVVSKSVLGLNKIEYYDIDTKSFMGNIEFNEETYDAEVIYTNKEDQYLRIIYSSLTLPLSVLEYDFSSKILHTRKTYEIPSGYDPSLYQAQRLWVESSDGVQVPISMVYKKDCLESPANLLLYAYGSYGQGMGAEFSPAIISLLDRGFIYVIAHIRGGDELGFDWYESAKFLNKKRTFEDFIAVSEYLIEYNYTSKDKLAIMGASAGGMLMGVVVNQRPELFKSVVAQVPFVDVLNTMLDDTLPLTPGEWQEWGNPASSQEYYDYIKSYSPYDNVKAQNYPHMLVTAGLNDPRVTYWEPAKWVAKLKEHKLDDNLLLLKTEMDAGHQGQSGKYKGFKETAMIFSFIITSLAKD